MVQAAQQGHDFARSLQFALIAFLFSAVGCSSNEKAPARPTEVKAVSTRNNGSKKASNPPAIKESQQNSAADEGFKRYQQALAALQQKDYLKALPFFQQAEVLWKDQPRKTDAQWGILRTGSRAGNHREVIRASDELIAAQAWTVSGMEEIYSTRLRAEELLGDFPSLVLTADRALQASGSQEVESIRSKATDTILGRLSQEQLNQLKSDLKNASLRMAVYFRLGELAMDAQDRDTARDHFERAASFGAGTELGKKSQDLVDQIQSLRVVRATVVGAVLPLSGKFANQGQRVLRGLQSGLGSRYSLAVVDSEGTQEGARRAVERLVKEDKVIAVVGELLSKTSTSVAVKATELGVPSVSLAQKVGLTEIGPLVFRNAVTSEMQVRTLVEYSMNQLGLRKFAVLFPNDSYGVEFANLFWDEVKTRGGEIVAAQTYKPSDTDFRTTVQKLVQTYDIDSRAEEYRLRLKAWKEQNPKASTLPEDLLPPWVDFDAIFIPDQVKALGQIAPMLSYSGVKGVKLLGTQLWNTESLGKRVGAWAPNCFFVDSILPGEGVFKTSAFYREYLSQFGDEPGFLDLQAYETGLLMKKVLDESPQSRANFASIMARQENVDGVLGPLQMSADRELMRPLVNLTLLGSPTNAQIVRAPDRDSR